MGKVEHTTSLTDGGGDDDHEMQKPSVIFDCNEMMELEEMMGNFVKHARSAPVVDYLFDKFQLKLSEHGHGAKPYMTKPFYLLYFQKYFKEIRDGKTVPGPQSQSNTVI